MTPSRKISALPGILTAIMLVALLAFPVVLSPAVAQTNQTQNKQIKPLSAIDQKLFLAVTHNDPDAVKAALADGADLNAQNADLQTAAEYALSKNYFRIAQFLLSQREGPRKTAISKQSSPSSISPLNSTAERKIATQQTTEQTYVAPASRFGRPPRKPSAEEFQAAHQNRIVEDFSDAPIMSEETAMAGKTSIVELADAEKSMQVVSEAMPKNKQESDPLQTPDYTTPRLDDEKTKSAKPDKVSSFFKNLASQLGGQRDRTRPSQTEPQPSRTTVATTVSDDDLDVPSEIGTLTPEDLVPAPGDDFDSAIDPSIDEFDSEDRKDRKSFADTMETLDKLDRLINEKAQQVTEDAIVKAGPLPVQGTDELDFAPPSDDFDIMLEDTPAQLATEQKPATIKQPEKRSMASLQPTVSPSPKHQTPTARKKAAVLHGLTTEDRLQRIDQLMDRGVNINPAEILERNRILTRERLSRQDRMGQVVMVPTFPSVETRPSTLTNRTDSRSRFSSRISSRIANISRSDYARVDEYGLPITSRATAYLEQVPPPEPVANQTQTKIQAQTLAQPQQPEVLAVARQPGPSISQRLAGFFRGGVNPKPRTDTTPVQPSRDVAVIGGMGEERRKNVSKYDPVQLAATGRGRLQVPSQTELVEPPTGVQPGRPTPDFLDRMAGLLNPFSTEDPPRRLHPARSVDEPDYEPAPVGNYPARHPLARQPAAPGILERQKPALDLPAPWDEISNGQDSNETLQQQTTLTETLSLPPMDQGLEEEIEAEVVDNAPAQSEADMLFADPDPLDDTLDDAENDPTDVSLEDLELSPSDSDPFAENDDAGFELDFPEEENLGKRRKRQQRLPPKKLPYSDPLREPAMARRKAPDSRSLNRLTDLYHPDAPTGTLTDNIQINEQEQFAKAAPQNTPNPVNGIIAGQGSFWDKTDSDAQQDTPVLDGVGTQDDWQTTQTLTDITLTLGESVTLENSFPPLDNGTDSQNACVNKNRRTTQFCIEPIDWPESINEKFIVPTILYNGPMSIVRYDQGTASRIHSLFATEEFEIVRDFFIQKYGFPTETWQRSIAPLAQPRQPNPTLIWRNRDSRTNTVSILELRKYDDSRGGFPDVKRGAVMLYYHNAPPIFPVVSAHELMRVNRKVLSEPG